MHAVKLPVLSTKHVKIDTGSLGGILDVEISNRVVFSCMANGGVLRYFIDSPVKEGENPFMVPLPQIAKVFVSPTAGLAIASTVNAENYAILLDGGKPVAIPKLKGQVIECVIWEEGDLEKKIVPSGIISSWISGNKSVEFSGAVLLGTQSGKIILVSLGGNFSRIIAESASKIRGLFSVEILGGLIVYAATSKELYSFSTSSLTESPVIAKLSDYLVCESPAEGRSEIVGDDKHLFWLCEAGTVLIDIDERLRSGKVNKVIPHSKMFGREIPRSIALTNNHILYLLESRLVLVSKISCASVVSIPLPIAQAFKPKLVQDQSDIYCFGDRRIFQIGVAHENAATWKFLLDNEEFDKALEAAKGSQKDIVKFKHAEFLMNSGECEKAASLFACVPDELKDFESVCLLFIESKKFSALLIYLQARLGGVSNAVQASSLFVWCVEIYAGEMSKNMEISSIYQQLQDSLHVFISDRASALDKSVVTVCYEIYEACGLTEEIFWLADAVGDVGISVGLALELYGDYEGVLSRLSNNKKIPADSKMRVVAEYSSLLFKFCPAKFIDFLILNLSIVDPCAFSSVLATSISDLDSRKHAIRFIEACISNVVVRNRARRTSAEGWTDLLNVLTRLKAKSGKEEDLINFLESCRNDELFDYSFALRECRTGHFLRAEVHLHLTVGSYSEALLSALNVPDISLAKKCAEKAGDAGYNGTKGLWINICKYLVRSESTDKLLEVYRQAQPHLKLSDVLCLMPMDTPLSCLRKDVIDYFERSDRESLALMKEIEDNKKALALIKDNLRSAPDRCVLLQRDKKCELCHCEVYNRRFFAFICGHCFHMDCMKKFYFANVAPSVRDALERMEPKRVEQRISSDCPFCGDSFLLESVNAPFVDFTRNQDEIQSWQIESK